AALEEEKKFRDTIAAVNRYIKADDFKGAENSLKNAQTLSAADPEEINRLSQTIETKKQEDEKQNGTAEFQRIEDTPTLAVFLDFKAKYPRSRYLEDLKDRIKKAEPNLPPEKYWGTAIFKNRKGYYESSFGDVHNLHRMVYLPARNLWIDKYEVSNGQFRRYLKSRGRAWPNDEKSRFLNDGNEYPVVVRIGDAEKYCKAYGLRLPSQNEWEYAAGKGAFNYPWGNDEPNTGGKWRANFDSLGDSGEQDGFEGTAPVVSFEVFSSPFDLVNMSGNVWEWVQGGLLKGGSFLSDETDLTVTNRRGGREKDKEGFRCIKEEKVEKVESKENQ
ncbi:MAG: formylglycine-generating enzyme family protein, partial [bacterium]|nr:formylglycine-generating enzyme family protein [bacterium]